jgi:hypothetical protein
MARVIMSILGSGLVLLFVFRAWFPLSLWLADTFALDATAATVLVVVAFVIGFVFVAKLVYERF